MPSACTSPCILSSLTPTASAFTGWAFETLSDWKAGFSQSWLTHSRRSRRRRGRAASDRGGRSGKGSDLGVHRHLAPKETSARSVCSRQMPQRRVLLRAPKHPKRSDSDSLAAAVFPALNHNYIYLVCLAMAGGSRWAVQESCPPAGEIDVAVTAAERENGGGLWGYIYS